MPQIAAYPGRANFIVISEVIHTKRTYFGTPQNSTGTQVYPWEVVQSVHCKEMHYLKTNPFGFNRESLLLKLAALLTHFHTPSFFHAHRTLAIPSLYLKVG